MKEDEERDFDIDYSEMSKELDEEGISEEELNMMYESFGMVKDLQEKISDLHSTKDNLQDDIFKLTKKVEDFEQKEKRLQQKIKEDEVKLEHSFESENEPPMPPEPLSFVGDDETENVIIPNKKNKQEFVKEIKEEIEKKELKFEKKEYNVKDTPINFANLPELKAELLKEFEPIINKLDMRTLQKNVIDDFNKLIDLEFNKLKSEIDLQNTKDKRDTVKRISDLESRLVEAINENKELKENLKGGVNNSIDESDVQNKIHLAIERYFEKNSELHELKNSIEEKQNILKGEVDLIKKILNEFIDDFNAFSKQDIKTPRGSILSEDEKEEFKDFVLKRVESQISSFNDKILDLSDKLKTAQSKVNIERGDTKDQELVEKVNEIIENFNEFKESNKIKLEEIKLKLVKEIKGTVDDLIDDTKKKISKQILSNNEFLTKINTQNRELKRDLNESVENKFILAKKQYEELFNKKLKENESVFESHLKHFEKEQEGALKNFNAFKDKIESLKKDYQDRLKEEKDSLLEFEVNFKKDKNAALIEFDKIRKDLDLLMGDYDDKLISERTKFDNLKVDFEKDKKGFMLDIESTFNSKKLDLNKEFESFRDEFTETFKDKMHLLENYDEKYKILIEEKYKQLVEISTKRLEDLERKFVDKDFEYVKEKIDENLKRFSLYEERLSTKEDEVLTKIDYINDYQQSFFNDMNVESQKMKEKVEYRLTTLEKSLNKRFLDYGSEFDSLKGTLIDEVEDLVKKVDKILSDKSRDVENKLASVKLIDKGDITKEIASLKIHVNKKDDEIQDLKSKLELTSSVSGYSLRDYVEYAGEYEKQLVSIIHAFKNKGVSNDEIKHALIKKGHPKIYVLTLLNFIDEL